MVDVNNNYIVFKVNDFFCSLNCLEVQEINRDCQGITSVKRSPAYISGVINLRGDIVSIIDLSVLFNFEKKENATTTIVVVNYDGELFGFVVTEVLDIVTDNSGVLEKPPTTPNGMKKEYLKGIFTFNEELVSLLSVSGILADSSQTNTEDTV
jgi:purine-binding chemotaxis protein CheW